MKILLDDGLQASVGTGIGSYATALARALSALPDTAVSAESFSARKSRRLGRLSYLRYLSSRAYREKLTDFDAVLYANYAMPKKCPRSVLSVVTVHDLTAFSYPETLPRAYALYNRHMVRRALAHADVVLTVSDSIKQEIEATFPKRKAKLLHIYPIHHGAAISGETPSTYENHALNVLQNGRFFLFVGTLEKRKNLADAVNAFAALRANCPDTADCKLVLAGRAGFDSEALFKLIEKSPVKGDILLPGYVSAADRKKLYREAAAFLFPSLYEGFGSPQTECMACGLPLLASDIPTNREVSEGYAEFYPTGDINALAALMQTALTCPKNREELTKKAAPVLEKYAPDTVAATLRAALAAEISKKEEQANDNSR